MFMALPAASSAPAEYKPGYQDRQDPESRGLRNIVILAYVLAGLALLTAPMFALRWSRLPFPGFLVEHTLVVPDIGALSWEGRRLGLSYPHRVTHVGDRIVNTSQEYHAAIAALSIGDEIQIQTIKPDGSRTVTPPIRMTSFPTRDFLRLFWLPYGIGLAYFGLGLSIFRMRSLTRPGRAFGFFCAWAALSNCLTFNLSTTHVGSILWPLALSLQGGSLLSLALFFPEAGDTLRRRPRLRHVPFLISLLLVAWALPYQSNPANPWAYVRAWQVCYLFSAAGIIFFLGMAFYRQVSSASPVVRQQARVILWGSTFAFLPLGVWFASPIFNLALEWNPAVFLTSLLIFPVAIGFAITRYRLWDLDALLNRALVYSLLTASLGLIYYLAILTLEILFIGTSERSHPFIIAAVTLGIAVLFSPVRQLIQTFIDRRFFRQKFDLARTISSFGETIRSEVNMERLNAEMVSIVQRSIQPAHVTLCNCIGSEILTPFSITPGDPFKEYLQQSHGPVLIRDLDLDSPGLQELRQQGIELVVPLISQGELVGLLNLGPRRSQQPYAINDFLLLNMLASQAAPALRVAQLVHEYQQQALERQRIEAELRVAQVIQNTLIPDQLPDLPGWQFCGYYQPAREVGGDFYDFINLPDGKQGILMGDATGKGVPAALVMATARSLLRSVALEVEQPAKVLQRVNDMLYSHIPDGMFVTCLVIVLEPESGRITFANAGHNLPNLARSGSLQKLRLTGAPLGIFPDQAYDEGEASLLPGDSLFLYSDGLVEAHDGSGAMLGFDGLAQIFASTHAQDNPLGDVIKAFQEFTGSQWQQEDDIALVVVQRCATS